MAPIRKMGRPPKGEEKRTITIDINVNQKENSELEAAAATSDIPLREWIREAALQAARKDEGKEATNGKHREH